MVFHHGWFVITVITKISFARNTDLWLISCESFSFQYLTFLFFRNTPQNCPSSGQFSSLSISRDMHPKTNIIISLWLKQISQQTHRQISPYHSQSVFSSLTLRLSERKADFRKPFSSNYLAELNDQCFIEQMTGLFQFEIYSFLSLFILRYLTPSVLFISGYHSLSLFNSS